MWSFCGLIPFVLVLALGYLGISLFNKRRKRLMLDSWAKKSQESKDVVFLHGLPRAYTVPTGSPFVLKLETYLRMANIPYTYDTTNSFGENEKCPWISLNGKNISDSQLIIDYLGKKFEKNFSRNYSKEQLARGTAIRVMTEEHLFWSLPLWMFAWEGRKTIGTALPIPKLVIPYIKYRVEQGAWGHGIGRHSEAEIHQLMRKDIESISIILGNKPFLLGDEPCEDDCALFGLMAQFVWGGGALSPESRLLLEEYQNIPEYCIRMKERFGRIGTKCLQKQTDFNM